MIISDMRLKNYRNYESARLTPCPGVTVLHGKNASGKTNILEAIALACTGRSHRTPRDRELLRWNCDEGYVKIESQRRDGGHEVDILLKKNDRRVIRVNGGQISRSGELMGHISCVMFAPEDLKMIKDGPGERRRFVDVGLAQARPAYYYALQRYNRALAQRNQLLRDMAAKPSLASTLPEWDDQLSIAGAQIISLRRTFISRLAEYAEQNHQAISGGSEHLSVAYRISAGGEAEDGELAEAILGALASSREADARRMTTTAGPHRDDLVIEVNGIDVRVYGSQGQQRTAALALKLAELSVMKDQMGEWPVLLLDDVMSELDPDRRRFLLSRLSEVQTLVTCTDPGDLSGAEVGAEYAVSGGVLTRVL